MCFYGSIHESGEVRPNETQRKGLFGCTQPCTNRNVFQFEEAAPPGNAHLSEILTNEAEASSERDVVFAMLDILAAQVSIKYSYRYTASGGANKGKDLVLPLESGALA